VGAMISVLIGIVTLWFGVDIFDLLLVFLRHVDTYGFDNIFILLTIFGFLLPCFLVSEKVIPALWRKSFRLKIYLSVFKP